MRKNIPLMILIILLISNVIFVQGKNSISDRENHSLDILDLKPLKDNDIGLLIITPSKFNTTLIPFIEHKEKYHIHSWIINPEHINGIGRDKPEQIKYAIKECIETNDISYVLLIGNKSTVPVRYTYPVNISFYTTLICPVPSDLYYADIYDSNGNFSSWDSNNDNIFGEYSLNHVDAVDLFPDIAIGRLYCNNETQLDNIIQKIIEYETNTNSKEWFDTVILCGGNTHPAWKDIALLIAPGFKDIFGRGTIALEGEYICDTIGDIFSGYQTKKYYASANVFLNRKSNVEKLTTEHINTAINQGAGFLFLIGHGTPTKWITHPPIFKKKSVPNPYYGNKNLLDLNNKGKYPIVILDACSTGDYRRTDSPLGWEFVSLKQRGAIACLTDTTLSFGMPGTNSKKAFNNLFTLKLAENFNKKYHFLGDVYMNTINDYMNNELFDNESIYLFNLLTIENRVLFGDPTLKIGGYAE